MSIGKLHAESLRELIEEGAILFPLEVRQYHRMIAEGIIPEGEPFELLDGQLVRKDRSAAGEDPMTVGNAHAWVIGALIDLNPKLKRHGCHIRVQLPLTLPPIDEPEPDGAIVAGSNDDYRDCHPDATQVTCVIEVADSSLRRDRGTKLRTYAGAKIPCYVIINLIERVIEVYTEPLAGRGLAARYGKSITLAIGERINFPVPRGRVFPVRVRKLLP